MTEGFSSRDDQTVFLLTVDVEDWFQVENFKQWIPFETWGQRELRVVDNTLALLDFLDSRSGVYQIKATFFVLGWLAERYPRLVSEIHARGHEVASHGYNHRMVPLCSDNELFEDLSSSRKCLEDILGKQVKGYRAPSFSIEPRLIGMLKRCGYHYDSSYNSFSGHGRYGTMADVPKASRGIFEWPEGLYEIPVSNLMFRNRTIPWGGGGFFRLIPERAYTYGVKKKVDQSRVFLFYIHPWEIDPGQPRVTQASIGFKFRHYVNLNKTLGKLAFLMNHLPETSFLTCSEYLDNVTPCLEKTQIL
ncbi:DUF3473 domain-containing protein [Desulfoluna sp.]|uniref:DUF3473 domain-containing protein n=1 Tax=Desulfoluna sp. TaxID=2045199 RepID=UPI0026365133|nr:DUF3473 domain-containing protein [Desulfoluna sp.]